MNELRILIELLLKLKNCVGEGEQEKLANEVAIFLFQCDLELLQEVVDRAAPMKPEDLWRKDNGETAGLYDEHLFGKCKKCSSLLWDEDKFCSECGQALDWSEKEEE